MTLSVMVSSHRLFIGSSISDNPSVAAHDLDPLTCHNIALDRANNARRASRLHFRLSVVHLDESRRRAMLAGHPLVVGRALASAIGEVGLTALGRDGNGVGELGQNPLAAGYSLDRAIDRGDPA